MLSMIVANVYAFVYSPLPIVSSKIVNIDIDTDSWFERNWYILLPCIIGGAIFIGLMWLLFAKFYTYRKRYHEEREKVKGAKEELQVIQDGGYEDPDADMIKNPLAQQMQNMRGVVGLSPGETHKRNQNEMNELEMQAAQRNEVIASTETEVNELQSEIANLQRELSFRNHNNAAAPEMVKVRNH